MSLAVACFECGAPAEHQHHVIPQSRGGTQTVPLCVRCHDLVHDRAGSRTDTLGILSREGRGLVVAVLTIAEQAQRNRRFREVVAALHEKPGRLLNPPVLVKDRRMGDVRYDDPRPWLLRTLAHERHMRELMRGRRTA